MCDVTLESVADSINEFENFCEDYGLSQCVGLLIAKGNGRVVLIDFDPGSLWNDDDDDRKEVWNPTSCKYEPTQTPLEFALAELKSLCNGMVTAIDEYQEFKNAELQQNQGGKE